MMQTHEESTPQSLTLLPATTQPLLKTSRPKHSKALGQLKEMQQVVFREFQASVGKPAVLFTLARAFVLLQESIRVTRGIPSPGQLRPDLDPVQLEKARKRLLNRGAVQMLKAVNDQATAKGFLEEPPPETERVKAPVKNPPEKVA